MKGDAKEAAATPGGNMRRDLSGGCGSGRSRPRTEGPAFARPRGPHLARRSRAGSYPTRLSTGGEGRGAGGCGGGQTTLPVRPPPPRFCHRGGVFRPPAYRTQNTRLEPRRCSLQGRGADSLLRSALEVKGPLNFVRKPAGAGPRRRTKKLGGLRCADLGCSPCR